MENENSRQQKRRTWRKFHIAVDPDTQEIAAMKLTKAGFHDTTVVADLLKNLENLGKMHGDGAEDASEL